MLRKKVILALSALLLLWIMGFVGFIFYTRSFIIIDRSVTDAIIVFTGGRQRIKTGISLLKAGYAPILFISGVSISTLISPPKSALISPLHFS